jgi:hypothetical protein
MGWPKADFSEEIKDIGPVAIFWLVLLFLLNRARRRGSSMQSLITISGKKIAKATTCPIRNVMTLVGYRLRRLFLDTRFLMQRLAPTATAQRVAVPVYRRPAVGVARRPSARMVYNHSRRPAGHSGGPWSGSGGGSL